MQMTKSITIIKNIHWLRTYSFLFVFSFIFIACKSQTNEERMYNTSVKIIDAILDTNTSKFISLIGFNDLSDISKTEEMINFDIRKYQSLFLKYLGGKKPDIQITQLYNNLGQRLVKIPIYKNNDTISNQQLDLHILFGPPDIVKLNKISGYRLVDNNNLR